MCRGGVSVATGSRDAQEAECNCWHLAEVRDVRMTELVGTLCCEWWYSDIAQGVTQH
jgi:hypothetical protein